ncbi:MAG TPA: cyclic nucleotide-binding domain-containing protein [bacterium]|nr:cyclic nucleotide-binding domain-containing protein [bacterium]HOL47480.1 cyclic nucleotide-binding domain-containing protein [bacterium]HPQ18611.1 cyclic nucleotide-binding domain-containing protein [bacterium]
MNLLTKLLPLYEKFGKTFKKGSVIFLEGDIGEEMYIIVEGEIEISKTYKLVDINNEAELYLGSDCQVLSILKAGDFFGEMALLNQRERSATAIALTDVKLIAIDKKNFEVLLGKTNPIILQILKSLSNRLREADKYPRLIPQEQKLKSIRTKKEIETEPKKDIKEKQKIIKKEENKKCEKCSYENPFNAKFCMNCGATL